MKDRSVGFNQAKTLNTQSLNTILSLFARVQEEGWAGQGVGRNEFGIEGVEGRKEL